MKKIILFVALVATLSASEFMCDLHTKRYQSANQMAVYAAQNGDMRKLLRYTKETLHSIEMTVSECGYSEKYKASAEKFKVVLKARIKELDNVL